MCGIVGIFNFRSGQPVDPSVIRRMAKTIEHRGPDDEGYYFDNDLGFGFRRLSIIDLAGGHQPMTNEDESIWVIFNGEIYNYIEIRKELEQHGYVFRTSCDTEVLVHGYAEWGVDFLEKLNGMFGLAVWDRKHRQLMLARDRAGIKLVYYEMNTSGIVFGSEMRPIHALRVERATVDIDSLYCSMRYRFTPSPRTIYAGIRKLAPGTRMVIKDGNAKIERYWNFSPKPFQQMPSVATAADKLSDLYIKSVQRQVRSDVPIGLLLSGGVDSALLLALMHKIGPLWPTFTVGYGEQDKNDELNDAAYTAKYFGMENLQAHVTESQFHNILPEVVRILEEPIASPSVVAMHFLCIVASKNVKVALMGQGPDELFGGYSRHLGVRYNHYWRYLPTGALNKFGKFFLPRESRELLRRGLYSVSSDKRITRYQRTLSVMTDAETRSLFREGVLEDDSDALPDGWDEIVPLLTDTDELGGLQAIEVRSTLPDELLMYADKISMSHGLELRVPYLDHEIIEYVEQLDSSYKIRWGCRKWLHRRVARSFLPSQIVDRRKRAFTSEIVAEWFRRSIESQIVEGLRDPENVLYEYMNYDRVQAMVREYRSGASANYKSVFSVAVFDAWLKTCAAHN